MVGVISDTHGLVRPQALDALKGSELILHAGDVGGPHVLEELRSIAPVIAVRGNNDKGVWAEALSLYEVLELGGLFVCVLHDLKELDLVTETDEFRVIVSGHSHRPSVRESGNVLYLNPGSAGPRRFRLPVSIARLEFEGGNVTAELVELVI